MIIPEKRFNTAAAALILIVTAAAYFPLFSNAFINLDDPSYIIGNEFLRKGGAEFLRFAFSLDNGVSYWHPTTWLSLRLDYLLFGADPRGYHGVNLLLHGTNALLLMFLLHRLTGRRWESLAVALLFALHPLNVESVAWGVERKTVLSTFFFFLCLHVYTGYVRRKTFLLYLLLLSLFCVGLMAKSMLVSLPAVLLLLDFWPLRRLGEGTLRDLVSPSGRTAIAEKIPLLALSVASVAVSLLSHSTIPSGQDRATLLLKMQNALVSSATYLLKGIIPAGLNPYYPLRSTYPLWELLVSAAVIAAATAAAVLYRKRFPWLCTGWLWYLAVLFPVCGIVRKGVWPEMADRFTYIPFVGIFIVVVWGISELGGSRKTAVAAVAGGILLSLAAATHARTSVWKTSRVLWEDSLRKTPKNYLGQYLLAEALLADGEVEEAIRHASESLSLNSGNDEAYHVMGKALARKGDLEGAEKNLRLAVAIRRSHLYLHDLAGVLLSQKKSDEALPIAEEVVSLRPKDPVALNTLGSILLQRGERERALALFRDAAGFDPSYATPRYNSGVTLYELDRRGEALAEFREALRLDSASADTHFNIATILSEQGSTAEALPHLEEALRLNPGFAEAQQALADIRGGARR